MNHLGLSAFYQVALYLNMTKAGKFLGITQSALSQRIAGLEDDLEASLFIRQGKTLSLTESGEMLLAYCRQYLSLENEVLARLRGSEEETAGVLRIASYSSILRSRIIPRCAPLQRQFPKANIEYKSYEIAELPGLLKSQAAEIVVSDEMIKQKGVLHQKIGKEDYVMIESTQYQVRNHVYLDHDSRDTITETFFAHQPHPPPSYERAFMGDVYGILEGVELGLGRAVMSLHLLKGYRVRIVPGFKKLSKPLLLHYQDRPYYSALFKKVLQQLTKNEL